MLRNECLLYRTAQAPFKMALPPEGLTQVQGLFEDRWHGYVIYIWITGI
jgi:hypothetical protein